MTERDFLFVGCERGHDWVHVGGMNARLLRAVRMFHPGPQVQPMRRPRLRREC